MRIKFLVILLLSIVAGCSENAEERLASGVVLQGGWLYVCGEYIRPPLRFTLEHDTLFVNGTGLSPTAFRPPSPVELSPTPRTELTQRAMEAKEAENSEFNGWQAAAQVYANDTLVSRVTLDSTYLEVFWADSTRVGISWDSQSGTRIKYRWWQRGPLRPKPSTRAEKMLGYVESLASSFGHGRPVFVGCYGGSRVSMLPRAGLHGAIMQYMAGAPSADSLLTALGVTPIVR